MCCEVLPQYTYVPRAYLTVKTYVLNLRGVLERQTPGHLYSWARSTSSLRLDYQWVSCAASQACVEHPPSARSP
jgi:hypothetical protein